ncbi:MAG: thioredoxin family protein [Myxococcales bacterium]|nr:thioredoxin family protein [Myxococcales bacterium]
METIVGMGPGTVIHDQDILTNETRLTAELGVLPWLSAGLVLPLRVFDTAIRYLDAGGGEEVQIENPFIHHHNETLVGSGDPWLFARMSLPAGGFTLGARLGVSLPLGRTEEDPFELGDRGIAHEHSQFGTGTFQPLLGLEVARIFGPVRAEVFGLTLQSLYENDHGYYAGDRYAAGAGASSALGTTRWRFRTTVEVQHETAEKWNGIIRTDEGNIGRTDLLVGAEAMFRITDDWHLGAQLKIPVYVKVQGGQLDMSPYLGLSFGGQVSLFGGGDDHHEDEDDHDHDHGHGDEHGHDDAHGHDDDHGHDDEHAAADWTGLDKVDITNDGSAVPLEPVPGKITVFDFWATWCKPCGEVDRDLAALARKYPNDLAVRKVNVVDDDSPASKKYIGAATLPHLKVYGRDGQLLWERSAPPETLRTEVEKLLAPAP